MPKHMPKNVKMTLEIILDGETPATETLAAVFGALDVPLVRATKVLKFEPTTAAEDLLCKNGRASRCYACDARAVGTRDRRQEGEGRIVPACVRHADPPKCELRAEDIQ